MNQNRILDEKKYINKEIQSMMKLLNSEMDMKQLKKKVDEIVNKNLIYKE